MRIPPYYQKPKWQLFFAGMTVGAIISWCIFIYIFGALQEEQAEKILKQAEEISKQKDEIKIWQEEFQELNKKNIEQMTLQEIKINLVNPKKYDLDGLTVYEIEEDVKDDLSMIKAKDLETVNKSSELLRRVIENKVIKINDKRYRLEMKKIYIYTTLSIDLEIHLDK